QVHDICQNLACGAQARRNIKRLVKVRVINQTLPTDGSARFFEVDAHDNFQIFIECACERRQAISVIERSDWVMNGARTNHNNKTVVLTSESLCDFLAVLFDL